MSDLIDRQAAIDGFYNVKVHEEDCTEYDIGYNDGIDYAINKLSVMPSAPAAEPRWIPVTERLPKLGEKVLVSTKNTVFTQVFKCIYGTPDSWGWEHHTIKKVTAWMPLPEPWKGEEGEAD